MILQIAETQEIAYTIEKVVPFYYTGYVRPFTKPYFIQFKDAGVLFQDKQYESVSLRWMVCFTEQRRTLLINEEKPKLVIETSPNKTLYTRFVEQGKVLLKPDEYGIVHGSTEYSSIILTKGRQEVIRLEFTADALRQDITQHYLDNFEQEKSWLYGSGKIGNILQQQLQDIIHTPANTPEEEAVFGARCREILHQVASEQITA
ncbi:hypothetical protein SAMN04488128_10884 [Chitinophaga eiseniae]|uniref:Uncharacterized protein n=1 Tax=Chitinophaga eiseniae TaxID=634771 RepID=A0A1T4U364_9BACT|nr:hypothetical protein [Chitinophaga eiseniae]SKA47050.1 hypothetical protein SAMN04488128_10884 [Chitinophaga eiseniae]